MDIRFGRVCVPMCVGGGGGGYCWPIVRYQDMLRQEDTKKQEVCLALLVNILRRQVSKLTTATSACQDSQT